MANPMVSGHSAGIIVSLILFFGALGAGLFLLRKNFRKGEQTALPKKNKSKAKTKSQPEALPEPQSLPQREAVEVPQISEMLPEALPEMIAEPVLSNLSEIPTSSVSHVNTCTVTSIHVAIWSYDHVLEKLNPEHAFEALNEFHSIGVNWAEKHQVHYERSSGGSFYLHWTDEKAAAGALKCVLELRREFIEWNDVRKAEGYDPFTVIMGADRGLAFWGPIGPEGRKQESIVGEVTARARALSQIALSLEASLLASAELWLTVADQYLGERVAEANLTALKNLTSCYKVQGYIDEAGQKIWVKEWNRSLDPEIRQADAPTIEKTSLWHVNNGSQILGPMSARDIARALYSLEIDFDCECWQEGSIHRGSIEKSGLFGGTLEDGAHFWVFDGDTLHGPFAEKFLKTEMGRKAFPRDSYVCEKSTVTGWKPLMELRASLSEVTGAIEVPVQAPPIEVKAIEPKAAPSIVIKVPAPVKAPVAVETVAEVEPLAAPEQPPADVSFAMPVLETVDRPSKKDAWKIPSALCGVSGLASTKRFG